METRDSTVINTRTSWYIGGTRVQPPPPSAQPRLSTNNENTFALKVRVDEVISNDFGRRDANVEGNFTGSQKGYYYNNNTQFGFNNRYNGQYNPGFN